MRTSRGLLRKYDVKCLQDVLEYVTICMIKKAAEIQANHKSDPDRIKGFVSGMQEAIDLIKLLRDMREVDNT